MCIRDSHTHIAKHIPNTTSRLKSKVTIHIVQELYDVDEMSISRFQVVAVQLGVPSRLTDHVSEAVLLQPVLGTLKTFLDPIAVLTSFPQLVNMYVSYVLDHVHEFCS